MKRRKLRHFDDIPGIQENLDYYATIIENEHERQLKDRIISINTVIDHRIVELAITPLQRFDEDNSGRPIRIIINSEGGSVNDGLPRFSQLIRNNRSF